jgi:nicotinamidase-related amidase
MSWITAGSDLVAKPKRIVAGRSCGLIIDVQGYFLSQIDRRLRARIKVNTGHFARLLNYFRIPTVVTLERSVEQKGTLPREIAEHLGRARTFEKDFFDLCKEKPVRDHLMRLGRKQVIVAGCETDVCVLQSVLGLLSLDYEVFVVEDLLFSSTRAVESAIARMKAEGALFLTYKTLCYELVQAVDGSRHGKALLAEFGPFPDDVPDSVSL